MVLLVEDASDMHIIVESAIGDQCTLVFTKSLSEATQALAEKDFALMLLDVHLPEGESFDFCKAVKNSDRHRNLPIIFLTAEDELKKKVHGFTMGADDYVVKPLEPNEFAARVSAKLRKNAQLNASVSSGGVRVDLATHRVFSETETGEVVRLPLTPIEAKIITQLIKNPGKVVSKEDLMKNVWGEDVHISAHTVDTHMSSLRRKLGTKGEFVRAVSKQGFTFVVEPA